VNDLGSTFEALADEKRRLLISLLRERPMRAGALGELLDLSPPALSRHLRVLREAGLIEHGAGEDDSRVRVYGLKQQRFKELRRWLDEIDQFWAGQLDAFKEHAERKAQGQPPRAPSSGKRKPRQ
jgi:DNA-binding transcriptional ArsR family regulator